MREWHETGPMDPVPFSAMASKLRTEAPQLTQTNEIVALMLDLEAARLVLSML